MHPGTHTVIATLASRLIAMTLGLMLTTAVQAADCYNDDVPEHSDLEPPIPGNGLLTVSDDDIARMLEAVRAYEEQYASRRSTTASDSPIR